MTALTPQARNRLNNCLTGSEWADLAHDIAEALESFGPVGYTLGEDERTVIREALKGAHEERGPVTLATLAKAAVKEAGADRLINAMKILRTNHEDAGMGYLTLLDARNAVYDVVGRSYR